MLTRPDEFVAGFPAKFKDNSQFKGTCSPSEPRALNISIAKYVSSISYQAPNHKPNQSSAQRHWEIQGNPFIIDTTFTDFCRDLF